MSLTKLETAALCLAAAALPLGYQWHTLSNAHAASNRLTQELQTLRADAFARERDLARTEHQVTALQAAVLPASPGLNKAQPSPHERKLYNWDENSSYVRLPKAVLAQIRFAPFETRVARDGKVETYQLPPLTADGTLQPALEAALGLSSDEAERLRETCRTAFADFYALAASHSDVKEEPFAGGSMTSARMKTGAFAEEGAQFRDQFKARVTDLLGTERAEAFWAQAAPMFTELFNDFGAASRELQLINNPNQGLELFNSSRNSSSIGPLSQRNGMPLPPALQAYADAWTQARAAGGNIAPQK